MIWLGSKKQIAKEVLDLILKYRTEKNCVFVECFCGSSSLLPYFKEGDFSQIIQADGNRDLILFYQELQDGTFEIPSKFYTKEEYRQFEKSLVSSSERFYVGNIYSYMGTFFHAYAHPKSFGTQAIPKQQKVIQNMPIKTTFVHAYYQQFSEWTNCVFYLDPPYFKQPQRYKLPFDTDEFWEFARKLSKNNVVLISELEAPSDFEVVWEKKTKACLGTTRYEKIFKFKNN
jgi:site-specific DNA-adenine methylase